MTQIVKIVPLGLIFILSSALAEAEPSCDSLNRLSASLASYRELQMDRTRAPSPDRLSALTAQLNAMTADPMFLAEPAQPPEDSAAVTVRTYLGNFQRAVRALRQGADRSVLDTVIPPAFGPAFMALQQRGRCPAPDPAVDLSLLQEITGRPGSGGQVDPSAMSGSRLATQRTGGRNLSPVPVEIGALRVPSAAEPLQPANRWLLVLGLVMAACAVLAYANHRSEKQGRRRSDRHFVNLETSVLLGGQAVPMTIVDITPSGVKLRHRGQIGHRRKVRILLLDSWRTGRVRWKNVAFAGVSFSRRLSVSAIDELVGNDKAVASPASDITASGEREKFARPRNPA